MATSSKDKKPETVEPALAADAASVKTVGSHMETEEEQAKKIKTEKGGKNNASI
jgi:hypothetical protein